MGKRKFNSSDHLAWRSKVLNRDGGCVVCGNLIIRYCNVHHLIPHEFSKYEFDEANGIALCPSHHTLGKFSAHKNPIWFYKWMEKHRPEQLATALRRLERL